MNLLPIPQNLKKVLLHFSKTHRYNLEYKLKFNLYGVYQQSHGDNVTFQLYP